MSALFIGIVVLGGIGFIVRMMLLPGLKSPSPVFSTVFSLGMIIFIAWAAIFYVKRNANSEPFVVLYKEGAKVSGSSSVIPYARIQLEKSRMSYPIATEGYVGSAEPHEALKLKIEGFESYFQISGIENLSNQFDEPSSIKFPIGTGGLSEEQYQEFAEKFHQLKAEAAKVSEAN